MTRPRSQYWVARLPVFSPGESGTREAATTASARPGRLRSVSSLVAALFSLLPVAVLGTLGQPALPAAARVAPPSGLANAYLFQGARYDEETGFYYFRNRYYNPRDGRFLQRDPVWDEQNVGGWHTFVANSPANDTDPSGEIGPLAIVAFIAGKKLLAAAVVGTAAGVAASRIVQEVEIAEGSRTELSRGEMLATGTLGGGGAVVAAACPPAAPYLVVAGTGMGLGTAAAKFEKGEVASGTTVAALSVLPHAPRMRALVAGRGSAPPPVPERAPRRLSFTEVVQRAKAADVADQVAAARPTTRYTEFVLAGDPTLGLPARATPRAGFWDVFAHGTPDEMLLGSESLDFTALRFLLQGSGYRGGPLRLISCETGLKPGGAGQRVSSFFREIVLAPKERVTVALDGRIVITEGPGAGTAPTWIAFFPD